MAHSLILFAFLLSAVAAHTSPLLATSVSALSEFSCEPAEVVESSRPTSYSKGALSTQVVSPQEQLTLTSRTGKSGSLAFELLTFCSASSSILLSSTESSKISSPRKSTLNTNAKVRKWVVIMFFIYIRCICYLAFWNSGKENPSHGFLSFVL